MKNVTMRDIAREMNISAVSVSKALSGRDGVSAELRKKIIQTATDMGYVYEEMDNCDAPHYNIGVMVSETFISDSAFYSKLFQNLAIEFGKKQHSCSLEILSHRDERDGSLPMSVLTSRYDGVIVLGPISDGCMKSVLHLETPCIFVDNYTPEADTDCVVSDNLYGTHMLTNYLIRKGFTKIAYVGDVTASNSIMDRYLGYLKALMQNGIPANPEYVLNDRDEAGYLRNIELPDNLPDAFVCNCDEVAYHLIEQLKSEGISVPGRVSVVGFDDYIFATISKPQLTTFRVNMEEMSRVAVDAMERKIERPSEVTGRRVINGEMIFRESVRD